MKLYNNLTHKLAFPFIGAERGSIEHFVPLLVFLDTAQNRLS